LIMAITCRRAGSFALRQYVLAAGMPGRARTEFNCEADPAIRVGGARRRPRDSVDELPPEVSIAVGCPQLAGLLSPCGHDVPTTNKLVRLHLAEVSKIRTKRDLETRLHADEPGLGHIEACVEALGAGPCDD